MGQIVIDWFTVQHTVRVNGEIKQLTVLELALAQLYEDTFVKRDAAARKLFFDLAQKNKWLDAPPPKAEGTGVLVVYPTLPEDVWTKMTEGEQLTKDPLEGIPGYEAEKFKANIAKKRRGPPDDPL